MPVQECPLCLIEKPIVKSHLIPQAMYDYCRLPGGNPISITSELVIATSRQLQDSLLCLECEGLLNRGGEDWLLPLLATIDGAFPFYDLVTTIRPDVEEDGSACYAAARNPEIQVDKLVHFGMGVFWKASVHSWSGRRKNPLIDLGPYGEPIRKFLRGEADFPDHMAFVVGVLPPNRGLISFSQPYRGSAANWHNFLFYIPGIEFSLCVGRGVDQEQRSVCIASNPLHPILVTDFSKSVREVFAGVWRKARKARNVEKYLTPASKNKPST